MTTGRSGVVVAVFPTPTGAAPGWAFGRLLPGRFTFGLGWGTGFRLGGDGCGSGAAIGKRSPEPEGVVGLAGFVAESLPPVSSTSDWPGLSPGGVVVVPP